MGVAPDRRVPMPKPGMGDAQDIVEERDAGILQDKPFASFHHAFKVALLKKLAQSLELRRAMMKRGQLVPRRLVGRILLQHRLVQLLGLLGFALLREGPRLPYPGVWRNYHCCALFCCGSKPNRNFASGAANHSALE